MNKEMYNELFKDVVICGRYPLEKLDEMKWFIKSLEDKITILERENQQLKKQLEYLRSGEYLNQLKFERNMLEDIVQNMEVSKEDKEFIDMTHRNTELLEENQQLKSVIKEIREYIEELYDNTDDTTCYDIDKHRKEYLLQILDKGEKNDFKGS